MNRWTNPLGDLMTLSGSLVLRDQIDLNVRLVGLFTKIVMPDESTEVEGGGRSDIGLIVPDFGHRLHIASQRLCDPCGLFERCPLRHINDELNLALIVEGEHLHDDMTGIEQQGGSDEQEPDSGQKRIGEEWTSQ